jgi:hypothetical protein
MTIHVSVIFMDNVRVAISGSHGGEYEGDFLLGYAV